MHELPFSRLLRLYLDPSAFFKDITTGGPAERAAALQNNRRRRGFLLAYMRRWAFIALVCLGAIARLAALTRGQPLIWIPLAALEVGFCTGLGLSLLSIAAYIVLGLED